MTMTHHALVHPAQTACYFNRLLRSTKHQIGVAGVISHYLAIAAIWRY